MLLQVLGFPFALIFFGGIISLAAVADPHHKRSAPRVGFTLFFAGLFSLVLSWGPALLFEWLSPVPDAGMAASLVGYLVGMIGGALLGYRLALRHKRHLIQSPIGEDDAHDRA